MAITNKTKILFFIGSLRSGGKERRLIELITYLKAQGEFDLMVVVTKDKVHYPDFFKLNIPYQVIKKKGKKADVLVFSELYKVCKKFNPHFIHSWGRMQSFYALPSVLSLRIPLINSQITAAPPTIKKLSVNNIIDRINFYFSKVILSNSHAGILSYAPPAKKARVIYNGINMSRFSHLPCACQVKAKYGITTPYAVVMAASFTANKDYDLFLKIAKKINALRNDITFIGVGGYDHDDSQYKRMVSFSKENTNIIFPGRISDVEALVNACNLGVLFSNKSVHGEGISNAVMEYMTLAKPVIANDAGGTKEIVHHNKNGYLLVNESEDEIVTKILELIDNPEKAKAFGLESKRIIEEKFTLDKMGKAFEKVYAEVTI